MQYNVLTKVLIVFLFLFSGFLIGIFLTPHLGSTGIKNVLSTGVVLIVIAVYSAVRAYIVKQRRTLKKPEETVEKTEVGFVVDTFGELVRKLKEKELELEKLRSLAEDRAVRIETYNENVLQSVQSGVISIDNSKKIKSINQSAEKTLGIKADDVIGRDCSEVFNEPLFSILKENRAISRGEYSYITRDKKHVWLGVNTSQLKNAANEAIGFILVFTDLTNVKALQMQVELKERLTQLGEMSAGIAHELRNPMSVVYGYAKLLSKKVQASNKATVNAILTEIKNMDGIISEFLAFAKPTDLNMTSTNLLNIIEETATIAVGSNQTIKVSIEAEKPVSVRGDEILLRQVFTNLFNNAVDAMPEGGNLNVMLNGFQDKAEVIISDTGNGISEDVKGKIFLPFYTTKEKGVGLGLALVQKIIVSHNGTIEVDSTKGEGTMFRIVLPVLS
ncbi:MAG: PAS domain-containing protein [Thermodesulfovibrionia bacterium]|nr:PAS domain-containing protein [Thermodesulfovibrionia bacterium]